MAVFKSTNYHNVYYFFLVDVENTPAAIHEDLIDQLEYAEPEEPEENYAIVEDDEGERYTYIPQSPEYTPLL